MRLFIDEAGDFAIPTSARDHKVAVGMGVAVSDATWPELASSFLSFKADLADSEIERGEPKWYRLNPTHRAQFCELVGHTDGISLTPVTLDLSHLALFPKEQWLEAMVESQMVKGERKGERYGVDAFVSFRLAEEWSQIRCLLAPFGYCP